MSKELLFESESTKIILTQDQLYGQHILKVLNIEYPSQHQIKQFFSEYDILKNVDLTHSRKAFRAAKENNQYFISMEYIPGITLKDWCDSKRTFGDKLKVAIRISEALDHLHGQNIIHRDLSNTNILVDPSSLEVKIIDFGYASKFDSKIQHLGNPENLGGTLPYISPEQTGRMNRFIDYRSDIYSLGVILFELFTGRLPFQADDAISMVHAHIAIAPPDPMTISDEIPTVLSDIILKLLSKNAESRYESAHGLSVDLKKCLEYHTSGDQIPVFQIQQNDFSGRFQINQKLYGREVEIKKLFQTFEYVSSGPSELVLVAGYSGTGKSSLVHEIHKPITQKRGIFVEGKFDQYQRGLPYFALNQALESFVNILLSEDEATLEEYRKTILNAVGEEGKVLTDVIHSLELVIGKQPIVAEVGGAEAQNRFNYVFRKFINALSTEEHPVVLFMDDVQWSDSGSLDLLSSIMTNPESRYFLCICAYRDNEVSASHPFSRVVEEMRLGGVKIEEITLQNLSFENVNDLISDSLNLPKRDTEPLTELVHSKTGGNAFFVNQFLRSLYEEELLSFDRTHRKWIWDIKQIKDLNLTDDVVELMTGKINRLPERTQEIVKLAACVGASFDISILSYIAEQSVEQCEEDLEAACSEGLIQAFDETYQFAHDRIQQAAYSLIPGSDRPPLHYQIGNLLLDQLSQEELDDRLFDVVNQLNLGADKIQTREESHVICDLNLKAGIKAKEASAFEPALGYLQSGIGFLSDNAWENDYDRALQLYTEACEAAFLCSQFDEMSSYINEVEKNGKDILAKLKPLEIGIHAMKAENNLTEALAQGFDLLDQLGEKLPRTPSKIDVFKDLIKTLLALRGKSNEQILSLPEATNPYKTAAMRICAIIAPSSYWGNPDVFPFIIWRIIRLSLKYGNSAVSSFGYATHGVILVGIFSRFKAADRFGQLGYKVLTKLNSKEWVAQVYTCIYALIVLWNDHINKTLKPLQESYHVGLETGAIEFACVNANIYCIHAYFIGKPLDLLEEEIQSYSNSFAGFKQSVNLKYNEIYRQAVLNLMGASENPTVLSGSATQEEELRAHNKEKNDRTGTFFVSFHKMILYYLFGEYEQAWDKAKETRVLLDAVLAKLEVAEHHFYEGLTAAGLLFQNPDHPDRNILKKRLKGNINKMKIWSDSAPMNFRHKYDLLVAEYARFKNQPGKAKDHYENAIKGASQNGYINEEALAAQRTSEFNRAQGNIQLQNFYLNRAYQGYQDWGAGAILNHLVNHYPDIIFTDRGRSGTSRLGSSGSMSMSAATDESFDIATILKSSQSISQEIVLSKLLQRMMNILIENLGATKGSLILNEDGELILGIQSNNKGEHVHVLENLPIRDTGFVPEKVIAYTRRTQEQLVFENIAHYDRFANDPYFSAHEVKSLIAFPIIHQGNMRGILYFENGLAEGAFTHERIQVLKLLSGQIATSLDNAILYESLERQVVKRTQQLQDEKKKSDELLLNILPERTAEELKANGYAKPRRFEQISVMFTDFKDFTKISSKMTPENIVNVIDTYFRKFDEIAEEFGIEKIKTIGDSYMCASGMNGETDHAHRTVQAAFKMRKFMEEERVKQEAKGGEHFGIRIGIHSGPVVAGVVGSKKFAYDIWGDTVNTASRMETNCGAWNINISGITYDLIKNEYECFHRGKIEAKNKGKIDMYYVIEQKNNN